MPEHFDNTLNELYSPSSALPILTMLRVMIDGLPSYFVNNNESITSTISGTSEIYQAAGFAISLPEDNATGTPRATLDFDPSDHSAVRALREAKGTITVTLWLVGGSTPNIVEFGPSEYECTDFKISEGGISVGLEVEPILDRVVPNKRFTPNTFPGLWDREA